MSIYGKKIKEAFLAGASNLNATKEYINELNVFPVPDGDTGTNMSMTLQSAVNAISSVESEEIADVCKALSNGSLRGARGNSGVIMSQIIRGFTNYIKDMTELDEVVLFESIEKARDTAYKAVIKPKEGTILTVVSALATKANEVKNQTLDPIEKLEQVVSYGDEMLQKTPDMLPILKEAGVVDSGGQGLMAFMHGVLSYFKGEEIEITFDNVNKPEVNLNLNVESDADIKFGYCTEFIINNSKGFPKNVEEDLKEYLGSIGDSLVVVADEELIKIHVHTNHPGEAFEKGLSYGFLTSMKVDNLRLEHQEKVIKDSMKLAKQQKESEKPKEKKLKRIGFIVTSVGEGIDEIFNDTGVDYLISGGQTMNPSTEDFLNAIDKVDAKDIFVFPNNSNIIMAAKQAKDIVTDKNIHVIETKNVLQGINCMIYYNEKEDIEEIKKDFAETIKNVKTIQVTYAVRNTTIDGIEIKEGNYIAIGDKGLLSTEADIDKCILDAYEKIKEDKDAIISIYYGAEKTEEEALKLKQKLEGAKQGIEVSSFCGGQPVYYYYISIE